MGFLIFVVASFILPSVLGNCCLPMNLTATIFDTDKQQMYNSLVDFNQNKMLVTPIAQNSGFEWELTDFVKAKKYTKLSNGHCIISDDKFFSSLDRCAPDSILEFPQPVHLGSKAKGQEVYIYKAEVSPNTYRLALSKDGCYPIIALNTDGKGNTETLIFTEIVDNIKDVSAISKDVSKCTDELTDDLKTLLENIG